MMEDEITQGMLAEWSSQRYRNEPVGEYSYVRELASSQSELGRKPGCKLGSCPGSFPADYIVQCLPLVFMRRAAAHVWATLRMVTRLPRLSGAEHYVFQKSPGA